MLRTGRFASGERAAVRDAAEAQEDAPSPDSTGFRGTCQNAPLSDWIQLIQMGRRDAVIVVRVPGHGEGRLWCRAGDVVDARWDVLTGEDAVYRLLSFESGEVTVDFATFERPRTIRASTAGLLLEAAYRKDTRVAEPTARGGHEAAPTPVGGGFHSTAPTVTGPPSLPPDSGPARKSRTWAWVAAAIAPLAVAFWVSSHYGTRPQEVAPAALLAAAPEDSFPVHVEAQPDQAEIRLDGQLVATRALLTRLPRDGRLHEIIITARGYVPELVTFRDRPPLEKIALQAMPPDPAPPSPSAEDAVPRSARRTAPARRAAPVALESEQAPAAPSSAVPSSPVSAVKAKVQSIDERQPRIQAIDDDRPRIERIE